jgi:septal ring factor EnvC (AmiA/AmiB activator)
LREIDQNSANLLALETDTNRELAAVEQARVQRLAALNAVSLRVSGGSEELAQLKHEEAAEEALLADLSRVLQDFPVDSQQSFATLRGRLPWPVEGRLTVRFQDVKGRSAAEGLRWNGVLIEAPRGSKVRSPYFGREVYADWLQGLGLLLIIAHTDNYMTLYGHAEVLYKSVGDWVSPGDVIAALPESGPAAPQLYFEIRDGRTPLDPRLWLKSAP